MRTQGNVCSEEYREKEVLQFILEVPKRYKFGEMGWEKVD